MTEADACPRGALMEVVYRMFVAVDLVLGVLWLRVR